MRSEEWVHVMKKGGKSSKKSVGRKEIWTGDLDSYR